jgi:hypothetical protein
MWQDQGTNEFVNKAVKVHKDKYDYSTVKYKNSATKINILCFKHGAFKQTPNKHLMGQGCPKCARERKYYNELTTESFMILHERKPTALAVGGKRVSILGYSLGVILYAYNFLNI